MEKIYLLGFMGAGKSSVGRSLSKLLSYKHIDMDELIEQREGRTIKDIFEQSGEEYFREKERELLKELSLLKKVIISTGGGVPCFFDNLELMKKTGFVVYLKNEPSTILKRLNASEISRRPLLKDKKYNQIEEILKKRAPFYEKADLILKSDDKKIDDISREIIKEYVKWKKRS